MLREYTTDLYEPAARRTRELRADGDARARAFVAWTDKVLDGVAHGRGHQHHLQRGRHRRAARCTRSPPRPRWASSSPSDIEVQILYGAVDLDDELRDPVCVPMIFAGDGDQPGWRRYTYDLDFDQAGNFGFTVRIVPFHRRPGQLHPARQGGVGAGGVGDPRLTVAPPSPSAGRSRRQNKNVF